MRQTAAPRIAAVGLALVVAFEIGLPHSAVATEACEPSPDVGEPAASARDVWVVSTRRLPEIARRPTHAELDVERLDAGVGRWQRSGLSDLLSDPLQPLVVFVHGNRYDAAAARQQVARLASRLEPWADSVGVRTVVFSWPSDKQGILVRDSRRKYDRAIADGLYLSWFLGHLEPQRPVALVGYSFGGLVTLEALADRARADGAAWSSRGGRTHLVLVAPAVRSDALLPRGPYRAALDGADRLTLMINSRDRALRFFRLVDPILGADALGAVGMASSCLPPGIEYVATDAASIIGREHSFRPYLEAASLGNRIAIGALDGLAE